MSEPKINAAIDQTKPNKAPLWKQITGALAGALVAFVIYQAYSFTTEHLQGAVTLPSGQSAVDVTRPSLRDLEWNGVSASSSSMTSSSESSSSSMEWTSSSASSSSDRVFYGPFGTLNGLKKLFLWGSSSSSAQPAVAVMESSSSSMQINNVIPVTDRHTWPDATLSFPTEQYAKASSSSSSSYRSPAAAWAPRQVPAEPVVQPEPSVSTFEDNWNVSFSSSSSSSSVEAMAEAKAISSPTWIPPADSAPQYPPIVAGAVNMKTSHTPLPKSGFGLDILAFAALGGALGGRKFGKKKKQ